MFKKSSWFFIITTLSLFGMNKDTNVHIKWKNKHFLFTVKQNTTVADIKQQLNIPEYCSFCIVYYSISSERKSHSLSNATVVTQSIEQYTSDCFEIKKTNPESTLQY